MASSLVDRTLQDVLSAFAAAVPTPGGGSACAAASAMGVALLIKAAAVAGVHPAHARSASKHSSSTRIDDDAERVR